MDCRFIGNAHAARGREEGLSGGLVDALRGTRPLPSLPADEAAVAGLGTEIFNTHRVSRGTFQGALDQLGAQGLTGQATLMGYHALSAFNASTFKIDLPETLTEAVLPV
jgi:hypothetical protein